MRSKIEDVCAIDRLDIFVPLMQSALVTVNDLDKNPFHFHKPVNCIIKRHRRATTQYKCSGHVVPADDQLKRLPQNRFRYVMLEDPRDPLLQVFEPRRRERMAFDRVNSKLRKNLCRWLLGHRADQSHYILGDFSSEIFGRREEIDYMRPLENFLEVAQFLCGRASIYMLWKNRVRFLIDDVDEARQTNRPSFLIFQLSKGLSGLWIDEAVPHGEDAYVCTRVSYEVKALLLRRIG